MTWRERVVQGMFRGVSFNIDSHTYSSGRRIQDHQFPFLRENYAEDLGPKTARFDLTCFFVGPNYDIERNRFLQALETPGPGILVHPYLHRVLVNVVAFSFNEAKGKQNFCSFSVQFIRAGSRQLPIQTANERGQAFELATSLEEQGKTDFEKNYDLEGIGSQGQSLISSAITQTRNAVNRVKSIQSATVRGLAELELQIRNADALVTSGLLFPSRVLNSITGAIDSLDNLFEATRDKYRAMIPLIRSQGILNLDFDSISGINSYRSAYAVQNLTQSGGLARAVKNASELDGLSFSQQTEIRDELLEMLQLILDSGVYFQGNIIADLSNEMYQILYDLRTSITQGFPEFNGSEALEVNNEFANETNAISGLYSMTGNIRDLDFFIEENGLKNGFIPAETVARARLIS